MIAQALEYDRELRVAALRVLEARAAFQIRAGPTSSRPSARTPERFEWGFPMPSASGSSRTASVYDVGVSIVGWS